MINSKTPPLSCILCGKPRYVFQRSDVLTPPPPYCLPCILAWARLSFKPKTWNDYVMRSNTMTASELAKVLRDRKAFLLKGAPVPTFTPSKREQRRIESLKTRYAYEEQRRKESRYKRNKQCVESMDGIRCLKPWRHRGHKHWNGFKEWIT